MRNESSEKKGLRKMKFPRTPHIPGSKSTSDDIHTNYHYAGEVVSTEKLDGSNILMSNTDLISRSGGLPKGQWADPLKQFYYSISYKIPSNIVVAGEYMLWRKSISYDCLPGPYIIFGIIEDNTMVSWEEVKEYAQYLELPVARTLSQGSYDKVVKESTSLMNETMEGYVIRPLESFPLNHYSDYVAKFVGSHHNPIATNNGYNNIA